MAAGRAEIRVVAMAAAEAAIRRLDSAQTIPVRERCAR